MLRRSSVVEYLARAETLDDFRWLKKLGKDRLLAELGELDVKPEFKTEPWLQQLVCFYIGCCHNDFIFTLDMGLGKTKIMADLITQVKREGRLKNALVLVPRVVNVASWVDDLRLHSNLAVHAVEVENIQEKWARLARPLGDVTLISYSSLALAVTRKQVLKVRGKKDKAVLAPDPDRIAHLQKTFNWIGCDEIHKLGNRNSLWYEVVDSLCETADFRYGATGTLWGRDPAVVHAQFYLVDRGATFGKHLGLFRGAFFTEKHNPWKGVDYVFDKSMEATFTRFLQNRSIRYDESEATELPQTVERVLTYDMGVEQREHYLKAVEGLINADGNLAELEAPWLRMRQIISGYLKWSDINGDHLLPFKHNPKLAALESLLEDIDGKVIVCYDYTDTGRMIVDLAKKLGLGYEWFYGGTKDQAASRRKFMTDPNCKVFVMNSETGGTGTNGLQGICNYMVFYETPVNPTTRKQTIKRIARPGQLKRTFVYDLVLAKGLDNKLLESLRSDLDFYDRVVNSKSRKSLLLGG